MFGKKKNKDQAEQQVIERVEETQVKIKGDKKIKKTTKKDKVIEDKPTHPLSFGERNVKDFIATDIDRTNEGYLRIGEKYVRSFIVNGYPSSVQVGWLNDLYNFDGDVDTAIHIIPSDERGALDQLTAKITQFQAQYDIEAKKGNIRNLTRYQDQIRSLVEQRRALEQNYENLYYIQIAANLYTNSLEELDKSSSMLVNKLKGKRVNLEPMYLMQEDSYRTALPIGQSFVKDKFRNFNSGALTACFPFYNSDISHKNGTFIGLNEITGTPIFIDFYDRNVLNNSNVSVFGQAGSGKTFFVSLLTLRSAIKGIRTVIIDPEGEYDKICRMIGGASFEISPSSTSYINPLDVEAEDEVDDLGKPTGKRLVDVRSKVADVLNLIGVMVGGMEQDSMAIVSHVLTETYKSFGITEDPESLFEQGSFFNEETGEFVQKRKKLMPTLSNVRDNLASYAKAAEVGKEGITRIVTSLGMFCSGGLYDMFDKQTSPELQNFLNNIVINFNVSKLEENILRPIGMYIAMSWTWEKVVKRNIKVKKRIICDEAWMLVNKNMVGHEFTSQFLENCARRIRKRNGGLLVASQNFIEFNESPQGKAVLSNTSVKFFLKQSSTDIDSVQEAFRLSDGEKNFLLSASRGEMLIKMNEESSVGRVIAFEDESNIISISKMISKDK